MRTYTHTHIHAYNEDFNPTATLVVEDNLRDYFFGHRRACPLFWVGVLDLLRLRPRKPLRTPLCACQGQIIPDDSPVVCPR